jgi:DHA3 family macrolide efflux protein-like MFS transporter
MKTWNTFVWIWLSQLLSIFGSAMTRFGLTIWAYEQTHQATTLALMGFFNSGAYVLASPLAGVIVDRFDRKKVIILSDLGAGLVTLGLLLMFVNGQLQIWHIYLAGVVSNALGAFQEPAFSASVRLLVPETQLVRANSLLSVANDGSKIFAPMLAGLLLALVHVSGIMLIDICSCLAACGALLAIRIPRLAASAEERGLNNRVWHEMGFGFRYIASRPGLLGILVIFTAINLFAALTYFGVLPAMILARSGGSETTLGAVQSVLGVGGVIGGVLLSIWGGPKKRVYGFLAANIASFLLGDFLFAIGRTLPIWIAAAFFSAIFIPIIVSCFETIWQVCVPVEMQGRVFSAKNMIQIGSMPLGYLASGILADRVFEPAMAEGGSLTGAFGWLVGTGPGAGMGLMFVFTCLVGVLIGLAGFLLPAVRNVESSI